MSRPRIRSVKPEMRQDERYGRLSRDAREMFNGLMTMADDEGRIRALPAAILGHVFPYDLDAPAKLNRWLGEITNSGMVLGYEHEGLPYLAFRHWRRHQLINRPRPSLLPPPPDPVVVSENAVDNKGSAPTEFTDESLNDHGIEGSPAEACARGIGSDRKGTPLPPEGEKRVTFDRKPVPPARLALAERVLAEFNRQAGTSYGAFTGRGRPSEDLKRIIGALTDAVPPLEFEEAREVIRLALANPKPYWDGKPHTGVVFGPKVIGGLREQSKRTAPRAEGQWSRGFVQAVTGEAA